MKKILLISFAFIAGISVWAQVPQLMNYQGVARSTSGTPLASTNIGLQISILDGSSSGSVDYEETQNVTTNAFGLYNVAIGSGTVVSGTVAGINWGTGGSKWIQVAIDPTGGTSYTIVGTSQLLSVPYALYAAGSVTSSGGFNYIPKFVSPTALGNSALYQSGSNIGLGTTTPAYPFTETSSTDTIINFISQGGAPTAYGTIRAEYSGSADVSRVSLLATSVRTTADAMGFGIEGAGAQVGVYGISESSTTTQSVGVEGDGYANGGLSIGVFGYSTELSSPPTESIGVYGEALDGDVNYAGYFDGDVEISGTLYASAKAFRIDHPLDPDNKYLVHSCVESNEMKDIYDGNVTTDASGVATVNLPSYFEALNKDFRYQLTVLGTFAQAIVSKEVSGNQFEIKTSVPNVKVSWQVTGVRHDAYANAHPMIEEQEKEPFNKGKYISAKELGKPGNTRIGSDIKHAQKSNNILPVQNQVK